MELVVARQISFIGFNVTPSVGFSVTSFIGFSALAVHKSV
jgi:hypothetical protein